MNTKMELTPEQQAILDGSQGETMAKVMKTLVMYGEAFGATKMIPVTSEMGHLVTSFGLKVMTPVYDLMEQLIEAGVKSKQKFSVDPNHSLLKYHQTSLKTLFSRSLCTQNKQVMMSNSES